MRKELSAMLKEKVLSDPFKNSAQIKIFGYVNATERRSAEKVRTKYGPLYEVIADGAFRKALHDAGNIPLTIDHGKAVYADTDSGTLKLFSDSIGLYAEAVFSDSNAKHIKTLSRAKKIKGWSFSFRPLAQHIDTSNHMLIRVIDELELLEISLIVKNKPVYNKTSMCIGNYDKSIVERIQ